MEHTMINLEKEVDVRSMVLYQKDNNLDKRDNLDELPAGPAVYAVCGRVNGEPANARFVGVTENLRDSIKAHFNKTKNDMDPCCKEFILSIKTKTIVFQELPDSSMAEREKRREEWDKKYKPVCNEVLNKIH